MADLRWTKALRAKLHGGRAPHAADPPGAVPEREAGWRYLVERNRLASAERIGLDGDPELVARVHKVLRGYDEARPDALDPELELYRLGLTVSDRAGNEPAEDTTRIGALVGLWLDTAGVGFALDLFLRPTPFTVRGELRDGGTHSLSFLPANPKPGMDGPIRLHGSAFGAAAWSGLRAWLMAKDDATVRVAIGEALPLRERVVTATRLKHRDLPLGELDQHAVVASFLTFAFGRDPRWAEEDARGGLERLAGEGGRHVVHPWLVLASLIDPELALAFATGFRNQIARGIGEYAYDVVEALGASAAPVLETLLIDGLRKPERAPIAAALKLAAQA